MEPGLILSFGTAFIVATRGREHSFRWHASDSFFIIFRCFIFVARHQALRKIPGDCISRENMSGANSIILIRTTFQFGLFESRGSIARNDSNSWWSPPGSLKKCLFHRFFPIKSISILTINSFNFCLYTTRLIVLIKCIF